MLHEEEVKFSHIQNERQVNGVEALDAIFVTMDSKYPQTFPANVYGDKTQYVRELKEGDPVKLKFALAGFKSSQNGNYYANIRLISVFKVNDNQVRQQPQTQTRQAEPPRQAATVQPVAPAQPVRTFEPSDDDLPF